MNKKDLFSSLEKLKRDISNHDMYYCLESNFLKKYKNVFDEVIESNLNLYESKTTEIVIIYGILLFFTSVLSIINFYFIPLIIASFLLFKKQMKKAIDEYNLNNKKIEEFRIKIDDMIKERHKMISNYVNTKSLKNEKLEKKYSEAKSCIDKYINGNLNINKIDKDTIIIIKEILKEELNTEEEDINELLKGIKKFYNKKDNNAKSLSLKKNK